MYAVLFLLASPLLLLEALATKDSSWIDICMTADDFAV